MVVTKSFGSNVGSMERPAVLFNLVKMLTPRPVLNILEIGSFRGYSAVLWRAALEANHKGRGIIVCVDPWRPYLSATNKMGSEACRAMDSEIENGSALRSFLDNTRDDSSSFPIVPVVGAFEDVTDILLAVFFDLIYIDGDHKRPEVMKDIAIALRHIRSDGLLCGDDLEIQYDDLSPEGREHARAYADTLDYTADPTTSGWFHPGVTMAMHECFGRVETAGNQWWIPAAKFAPSLGA